MNGIMLYRSRYGATKQYAEWIGDDLQLPVIDPEMIDMRLLATCNFLLIGTSVYNGELLLKDWLQENEHLLKHKKLFFFIVCAPNPDESKHHQIIAGNIPSELLRSSTNIAFLPGRLEEIDAVRRDNIADLVRTVLLWM
ncbi:MAG: hypothetical protein JST68_04790 [Bacteroidetes bacterium]|nr:hypothetical protein [Bacteroidota bacterium]